MKYNSVSKDTNCLSNQLINIIKSLGISYILTFMLLAIFAFIINYTNFPSSAVSAVTIIIILSSVLLAGIINGKKATEKGWLTGLLSGGLYMMILYIAGSFVFRDFTINSNAIVLIICGIFSGVFGGIIGINNKKKYRR